MQQPPSGRRQAPTPPATVGAAGGAPFPHRERHRALDRKRRSATEWRRWDSNPQPPPCKGGALPVELRPRDQRAGATGSVAAAHRSAGGGPPALRRNTAARPAAAAAVAATARYFFMPSLHDADAEITACVGLTGLEPVTSSLSGKRSNRLSYRPEKKGVAPPADRPGKATAAPLAAPNRSSRVSGPRRESPRARRAGTLPGCTGRQPAWPVW